MFRRSTSSQLTFLTAIIHSVDLVLYSDPSHPLPSGLHTFGRLCLACTWTLYCVLSWLGLATYLRIYILLLAYRG